MQKPLPSRPELERRLAELSLVEFMRQGWHVVEPAEPFLENWHLGYIAEHLEAVTAGEITRLLINLPPRHTKSLLTTVFWPCFEWLQRPDLRYLFVSYAATLSSEHSRKRRSVLESDWFRANWPTLTLMGDQNVKMEYENTSKGVMVSTSVGGSATGKGGNRIVIDDPIDPEDAYSDAKRVAANDYIERTLPSRLNVPRRDAIVMVMQRLHEDDPSGRILANRDSDWVHVCVPAECKERTTYTYPRSGEVRVREVGDVLWPARVDQHDLDSIKTGDNMTVRDFEAQYNQNPSPAGGTMFVRSWWRYYVQLPRLDEVIQSWDLSFDDTPNADYVVGLVMGRVGSEKYLLDMVRARADFPATLRMFRLLTAKWPQAQAKIVEKKANGAALISTLRKEIPGIIPVNPTASKEVRAQAVTATIEAGNVYIPAISLEPLVIAPEWQLFIDEHSRFPNGANDDIVDADTQGLKRLSKPLLIATTTDG